MPRPDPRAPGESQGELFDAVDAGAAPRHGRHSEAIERALKAERDADRLTDSDEAAAALIRAGGWALDRFEAENKPYGPAKLVPALTEVLRELRMTPDSRADATDSEMEVLINALGTPADAAAPVHDAP